MPARPARSGPRDAEIEIVHGGRAGWFRVASGFSALAAIEAGVQAWVVAHPPPSVTVTYSPFVPIVAVAVSAACFAGAAFLALRQRAVAGLLLLVGYAIPAVALFVLQDDVASPSILVIVSMIALIAATRRRSRARTEPAA
jgi:hypothetical protein